MDTFATKDITGTSGSQFLCPLLQTSIRELKEVFIKTKITSNHISKYKKISTGILTTLIKKITIETYRP